MGATMDAAATPTTQLDPAFAEQFFRRFFEAWNTLDGEALAALCTEDVVWNDPLLAQPLRGREEVRDFLTATGAAFPDFHVEPLGSPHIEPAEPIVLLRYRLTGTMRGTWSGTGLVATGRRVDVPAIDEWTFRGEQLSHYRPYFDGLDFCRQLGIIPPAGGAADRALTRLTNLRTRLTRRRT
jgi:steroid delta-isomerase-like uncharacterized protein